MGIHEKCQQTHKPGAINQECVLWPVLGLGNVQAANSHQVEVAAVAPYGLRWKIPPTDHRSDGLVL